MKKKLLLLSSLLLLTGYLPALNAGNDSWIDAVSLTHGDDNKSEGTDLFRVGVQKRWKRNWFTGGAWYLGGYWDTELAAMDPDIADADNVYAISITPVFRYQRDSRLSSGITPFAEAGLGAHLLSDTHVGDNDMSTAFQFGPLLGLGVGFGERGQYELSYRFTHLTNADIKEPNDGLDLHLLKLGYNFY